MTKLQIPYAYTGNKAPISPEVAEKGGDFSCPLCDTEVVLRRGDVRRPHFAHKPDTGCSGEGVRHKVAKQMIYLMYLRTVRSPMMSVTTFRRCPNCSQSVILAKHLITTTLHAKLILANTELTLCFCKMESLFQE